MHACYFVLPIAERLRADTVALDAKVHKTEEIGDMYAFRILVHSFGCGLLTDIYEKCKMIYFNRKPTRMHLYNTSTLIR